MKTIKIETKKLQGDSRYSVTVNGTTFEVMKRSERTYDGFPWDITLDKGNGHEWVQTFPTKKQCIEWLAYCAMEEVK